MKKAFALLLVAVMCFSLVACGKSKESMMEEAIVLDWTSVHATMLDNEARAKQDYDKKVVTWTATVFRINEKFAEMAVETSNGMPLNDIDVYLDSEDLAKLNKGETVTVVGILHLGSFTSIKDAYLVE